MIDEIYNSRIGAIKTCRSSDEWEKTTIPFEESLTVNNRTSSTSSAICKVRLPLMR